VLLQQARSKKGIHFNMISSISSKIRGFTKWLWSGIVFLILQNIAFAQVNEPQGLYGPPMGASLYGPQPYRPTDIQWWKFDRIIYFILIPLLVIIGLIVLIKMRLKKKILINKTTNKEEIQKNKTS
jgi:hypothetical protein